jgi:hypothetical protein
VAQHAGLSRERWATYSLDQQILMIANEMNRASSMLADADRQRRLNSYERVLRLADLTIATQSRHGVRRELLRWRDLIADLFVRTESDARDHADALRVLLRFTPESSRQIPYLLPRE